MQKFLHFIKKLTLPTKIVAGIWILGNILTAAEEIKKSGFFTFLFGILIIGTITLAAITEIVTRILKLFIKLLHIINTKNQNNIQSSRQSTSTSIQQPLQASQSNQHQSEQPSNVKKYDTMDGHEFEYFCADILKHNGFIDVEVTRGSGDYGIDILAKKDDITYAIQCKCYSSNIGNKAVQEAYSGKDYYKCMIGAVMTNRYFTPAAKNTATQNKILLWDRDKLDEFIATMY